MVILWPLGSSRKFPDLEAHLHSAFCNVRKHDARVKVPAACQDSADNQTSAFRQVPSAK